MSVQESYLEHKEMMHEAIGELDETLSLCDLPLYGVDEWEEDLSLESQGSTSMSSSEDTDYFEFFSHELTRSATRFPPENDIIFCGKIISYKQPNASHTLPSKQVDSKQPSIIKKRRGWSLFRWRIGNKITTLMQKKKHNDDDDHHHHHQTSKKASKKRYNSSKQGKGYDFPLQKMSVLTSSSSGKARWLLFLTGISRVSSKMELRDIKERQSRRHDEHETSRGSSMLWEVVRVLSCGGNNHPNAMVTSPISNNRLEGR